MKKLLAVLAISIFICGCQKDLTECVDPQISRETHVNLTKEGILKFESQSAFDQCMNEILQNPTNGIAIVDKYVGKGDVTRSNSDRIFNSVARIRADRETRVTPVEGQPIDYNDDWFVPEMTEEEFRDYIIDELLVDEELTYVLDSDLRIVVADTVYQITTDGVFIASYDNITLMEEVIDMYDPNMILNGSEFGYITYIGEGRYQYRDVQIIPNPEMDFDIIEPTDPLIPILPLDPEDPTNPEDPIEEDDVIPDVDVNRFVEFYEECVNIKEFATRVPIVNPNLPDISDDIPIETEYDFDACYHYFNDNVRIKAKLYKFNIGIYKSIGLNVKLQRRKRFLGMDYWVKTQSDGIDIVIRKLNVDLKCEYEGKQGTPYGSEILKTVSGSINDFTTSYLVRMLRHKIIPISPIKENKDIIAGTIGSFENTPALQAIFNASDNQIYTLMHRIDGLTIGAPHNRTIHEYDVRTAMICYGGSDYVRNYVSGVLSYPNSENNSIPKRVGFKIFDSFGVQFASAWNFRINNNIDETIRYADIFVRVNYDGELRGCQLYINEI